MYKLIARIAAGAALLAGMGGSALADSAGIELTGPGSTNVIDSHSANLFQLTNRNWVNANNWNWQNAHSGNVSVWGNTKVLGAGLGSGSAFNSNFGHNNVSISNAGDGVGFSFGGGRSSNGTIFLTGPGSFNRISSNNVNRFSAVNQNQVSANNFSHQNATSGNVRITGNTVVSGVGGSGNAANVNSGVNTVGISNSIPTPVWGSQGGSGNWGGISTTGPFSHNQIRSNNMSSARFLNNNNVSATNVNDQTARSGNVTISGNTLVTGVGGSGDAFNSNSGENNVDVMNN